MLFLPRFSLSREKKAMFFFSPALAIKARKLILISFNRKIILYSSIALLGGFSSDVREKKGPARGHELRGGE
jgi:hypothetical protein